jgi:hypothetical protein
MRLIDNTTRIPALRSLDRIDLAIVAASVVAIVAAIGCAGCGAKTQAPVNPGVSRAPAPNTSLSHKAPDASPVWEKSGEIGSYRRMSKAAFVSQGHFDGRWIAETFANALGAPEYEKAPMAAAPPQGSVIVQTHTERVGGSPGPVFAMVKREPGFYPAGGDWEYVVTLADGRLEDRGRLALCARCHAEGTTGWLFGLSEAAR